MEEIRIIIAAHKKYRMPEDKMYLPLHVGAEGKTDDSGKPLDLGYIKDNTGDNISELNPSFCELTDIFSTTIYYVIGCKNNFFTCIYSYSM